MSHRLADSSGSIENVHVSVGTGFKRLSIGRRNNKRGWAQEAFHAASAAATFTTCPPER